MAELLIVVDMQNDFVKGYMSTPEAREVVAPIRKKIEEYRQRGGGVLFTRDTHHDSDYGAHCPTAEASTLPKHCIQGTQGWEIVEELREYAVDPLDKPTFLGLELGDRVADLVSDGPDTSIELCGVCTDICVLSNALYLRARLPKSKITVDSGCCAGLNPNTHRAALTAMSSCLVEIQ